MDLGVVFNINKNEPELVLVHDHLNSNIGYSTYNSILSILINKLLDNNLYYETKINNSISYSIIDKTNPYYLNILNNYLPFPYKILWIKPVFGDINNILEESYEILNKKEE